MAGSGELYMEVIFSASLADGFAPRHGERITESHEGVLALKIASPSQSVDLLVRWLC